MQEGRSGKWRLLPIITRAGRRAGRQECMGCPGPGDLGRIVKQTISLPL